MFGLILILLGVVFLLRNLGIITIDVWNIIWPSILIIFGLYLLIRIPMRRKHWKEWRNFKDDFMDSFFWDSHRRSEKEEDKEGKE